jgi:hypothetical protein
LVGVELGVLCRLAHLPSSSFRLAMHIIIAVNDSEPSRYAFEWLMDHMLKEDKGHKLSILTVVEPPVQAGYYYAASGGISKPQAQAPEH